MRKLLCCIALVAFAWGLEPSKKILAESIVTSINLYENTLFVSTNNGKVEMYNIHTNAKLSTIKLDNITDYFGDAIAPKIFNTHTIDGKNILVVSQDSAGGSKISLVSLAPQSIRQIPLEGQSAIINKAYFVDKDRILIGFLSNEIWLFDIKNHKLIWSISPSEAVFSDLIMRENVAISTTEGGVIYVIDLKSGKITNRFEGANFDNVYMLASAGNRILSAGRDMICGIYDMDSGHFRRVETEFLSYAVGISADSALGAVSLNEDNDILIFDTASLERIAVLRGGDALPNGIIFAGKRVIAGFDSREILFWELER